MLEWVCNENIYYITYTRAIYKNGKAIPVTGRKGPKGCETSRLPHLRDSQLIDGGKVVSLTRRPPFTPKMIPGIITFRAD
jgi:hypothetical protein